MAKKPAEPKADSPAKKPARSRAPREVEIKPDRKSGPVIPVRAPIRFDAVLGQQRAIDILRASISSGRIHHAWIFHGPSGVGKFTTALAFAAIILDPSTGAGLSGQIEPDPESQTQRSLAAGTHPDLHIITKELASISRDARIRDSMQRNIAKEVLEEFLIEPATKTRSSTGAAMASKVFIVDEAELVDPRGQNSLLKTLEEPPPGSVLILITSSEDRLLPTIRSRCQRVAFAPLSDKDLLRWLETSGTDLAALDVDTRRWLLSYADGSPGAAQLAVQTGITGWYTALAPMLTELDRARFPIDLGTTAAKLIDEWAQAWVDRPGNDNASKDAANKAAARLMFRMLGGHFRARLRESAAKAAPADRELAAIDALRDAERQLEAGVQGVFVLDDLMGRIATA